MFDKHKYKKYLNGKKKIVFKMDLDHCADFLEVGSCRDIKFKSGNIYKCKFIKGEYNSRLSSAMSPLYSGYYEISIENQYLTFEQFKLLTT